MVSKIAIGGVAALVLGWGAVLVGEQTGAPSVEKGIDRCPKDATALDGTTMVLIDTTEPNTDAARERYTAVITTIAERMGPTERLSVHAITGDPETAAEPVRVPGASGGFALCKGRDPKVINRLKENESLVRAEYQREFVEPLVAAIAAIPGQGAQRSPILESIERSLWSTVWGAATGRRRLVLVSDMLDTSPAFGMQKGKLSDPCVMARSALADRIRARRFAGAEVEIYYQRNREFAERQSDAHRQWWVKLFYSLGSSRVSIDGQVMPASMCTEAAGKRPASPARRPTPGRRGEEVKTGEAR